MAKTPCSQCRGPGTNECSLARELLIDLTCCNQRFHRPKLRPQAAKKKLLPVGGSGEGVVGTMWDLKGGKKQPLMHPKKQAKEMGQGR